jgi:hypothetical protein
MIHTPLSWTSRTISMLEEGDVVIPEGEVESSSDEDESDEDDEVTEDEADDEDGTETLVDPEEEVPS